MSIRIQAAAAHKIWLLSLQHCTAQQSELQRTAGRRSRMCMMAPISSTYPAQYCDDCGCGYSTYWWRLMGGFNFVNMSCWIILLQFIVPYIMRLLY